MKFIILLVALLSSRSAYSSLIELHDDVLGSIVSLAITNLPEIACTCGQLYRAFSFNTCHPELFDGWLQANSWRIGSLSAVFHHKWSFAGHLTAERYNLLGDFLTAKLKTPIVAPSRYFALSEAPQTAFNQMMMREALSKTDGHSLPSKSFIHSLSLIPKFSRFLLSVTQPTDIIAVLQSFIPTCQCQLSNDISGPLVQTIYEAEQWMALEWIAVNEPLTGHILQARIEDALKEPKNLFEPVWRGSACFGAIAWLRSSGHLQEGSLEEALLVMKRDHRMALCAAVGMAGCDQIDHKTFTLLLEILNVHIAKDDPKGKLIDRLAEKIAIERPGLLDELRAAEDSWLPTSFLSAVLYHQSTCNVQMPLPGSNLTKLAMLHTLALRLAPFQGVSDGHRRYEIFQTAYSSMTADQFLGLIRQCPADQSIFPDLIDFLKAHFDVVVVVRFIESVLRMLGPLTVADVRLMGMVLYHSLGRIVWTMLKQCMKRDENALEYLRIMEPPS